MVQIKMKSGAQVKYKRRIRRISLQRFLCSRLVFQLEEVTFEELVVIYDNLLYCQDLAVRNDSFKKKFGKSLEDLTELLKTVNLYQEKTDKVSKMLSKKLKANFIGFIYPKRNLGQMAQKLEGAYWLVATQDPGTPQRQLPPKRFIGIGYRDKGSRRDRAKDGRPTWQEVAMSLKVINPEAL